MTLRGVPQPPLPPTALPPQGALKICGVSAFLLCMKNTPRESYINLDLGMNSFFKKILLKKSSISVWRD